MVDLSKRRVSPEAAKNGQWFEDPDGFNGIAVKITAFDTAACVKVRQQILEEMFGDAEGVDVAKYEGLQEYINSRIFIDAAVKDIRGLTNDGGKPVAYTPDYLRGILLKDQALDAARPTPDRKEFDPAAKPVHSMLLSLGWKAAKVREGEEKKQPPAGFDGGAASRSPSGTGETKPQAETDLLTDSSKDANAE